MTKKTIPTFRRLRGHAQVLFGRRNHASPTVVTLWSAAMLLGLAVTHLGHNYIVGNTRRPVLIIDRLDHVGFLAIQFLEVSCVGVFVIGLVLLLRQLEQGSLPR